MSQVIKNPTPRARFQELPKRITDHRELIADPAFEVAADYAMLNYVSQLAPKGASTPNFNDYAVLGVKVCGALEFLQEMRLLAESKTIAVSNNNDNLRHDV